MPAYYNENDAYAAAWLRNLIAAGHIAAGEVDERSIVDVKAGDLAGFVQCHFFAGIGGWSLALRLAGWPDDRAVWTGSCPCQPLSSAGAHKGHVDERHLWPAFYHLIAECRPSEIFGEQVASKDGREWFSGVRADLEDLGYAVGAADLCAASVGAPHIRQRLYWLADASSQRVRDQGCRPDDAASGGAEGAGSQRQRFRHDAGHDGGGAGRVVDAIGARLEGCVASCDVELHRTTQPDGSVGAPGVARLWDRFDFVNCTDGKARRFEPGSFPLAHGVLNRVGRLRGYGNAIVPQVAAEFIRAGSDLEETA